MSEDIFIARCTETAFPVDVPSVWASKFLSLTFSLTSLRKEKAQFTEALRRHLHTHLFHSVNVFFMFKDNPAYCI
jgi:hypothetical protein